MPSTITPVDRSELERAAETLWRLRSVRGAPRRLGHAGRRPGEIASAIGVVSRLPTLEVVRTRSRFRPDVFCSAYESFPRARRWVLNVAFRLFGRCWRFDAAVLTLPDVAEDYLRGRSRQAVRTNVRRAGDEGVQVADIGPVEFVRDFETIAHTPQTPDLESSSGLSYLGARDATGRPIAFACYLREGNWARLEALQIRTGLERSNALYLVHTELVSRLIASGVQAVFADAALRAPAGVRYLHERLGYRAVNVKVRRG